MGRDLDLDDVVAQYPEAKRELAELREEIAAWTGECEQLRQDLAAARALLAEANLWVREFDDDREPDSLYERIHAALSEGKK